MIDDGYKYFLPDKQTADDLGNSVLEIKILNQRKQLAQVVWDNKNVTWEKIKNVKKDFPEILKEYKQNMPIVFSNSPSKTEKRKSTRLMAIPTTVYKEACTEPHDDAISFDQEDDARYCKKGALLFQKK